MVMRKVFKTIAASFLCLTINVGYNVTNAMKDKDILKNCCNSFEDCGVGENSCNNFEYNSNLLKDKESDFFPDKEKSKQVNDDQNKDKEDKNDQDKDGKNKNIWRWLIGIIAGVGGLIAGLCLGKFAFNI